MEKNDIDNIKNDISIIKNNINTLSLAFNKHIQEHLIASSATQNDNLNAAVSDTDVSITSNLPISPESNDTFNPENQSELEIKDNLIDYSFIENIDTNKLLLQILYNNNKNMLSCYQSNFLKFCDCAVSLVEEVIKIFLEKKFIDIGQDSDNLLQACDLLEKKYKEKLFTFPDIYISKNEYKKLSNNNTNIDDLYYYNSNIEQHLSLSKLKEAKIIFTLELCFVTLYGKNFYSINYSKPRHRKTNLQTSSKALKRPPTKLAFSLEPLNKEFYSLIDDARKFRNIIEHNQNNREERNKKLQEMLLKKPYLKNIENNYDGIAEAVTWLIRQLYVAMR
ncbi:hypothetical protein [Nostoc sp. DSM 114159]|jgi:hypothetical protein